MLPEVVGRAETAVQFVAQLMEESDAGKDLDLVLEAADREEDVLLGDLEPGGHHGLEVRLVTVLPEARNLPRRGHLHAQLHVGAGQPAYAKKNEENYDGVKFRGITAKIDKS